MFGCQSSGTVRNKRFIKVIILLGNAESKALYQNIRVPIWLTQPRAQTRFEIRTTCLNTIAEELGV